MWNHSKKILLILFFTANLFSQSENYRENEVKAAYIEKFTNFIEWPPEVHINDTSKPFIIGIVGNGDINQILKEKLKSKKIKGKKVDVYEVSTLEDIKSCNLLFITRYERYKIDQILNYTEHNPILTISDDDVNINKDVIITLFLENNHVYFQINRDAMQKSGLYVSTLLLNLSRNIHAEENR